MHVQSCCFGRNGGVKNSGHVHTIPEAFCASAKIIRIGPLLTHKNGCGAISATERSCAARISKVKRHTSDRFCAKLWCSIGGFRVTSSAPCWWTVNKRSLISSLSLSTSICSFHHCYLCLPRLHENDL